MANKQVPEATSKESQMRFTLAKLSDEDIRLRRPLLEAASVAARLALDRGSHELREEAAKAWARIDAVMVRHLSNEDRTVLPWSNSVENFPRHLVGRARKKHEQILALHDLIARHSFEKESNEAVATGARNICVYATTLDDLIAGEERELFPVMRRVLFHRPQP